MPKNLSPIQKVWADYYVATGNGTEAARRAGYKGTPESLRARAYRNARNPKIHQYIKETYGEQLDAETAQRIADAVEVLEFLTGVMRGAVKDRAGRDALLEDRIKAAELLGKRYGLFKEVQVTEEVKNPFANLSEEELRQLATAGGENDGRAKSD